VLLLKECLLLFISLSTQSGKFWIHPRRLRVFENRVLRRMFGPKREEVAEGGEHCLVESFIIYTLHQILSG